MDSQIQNSPCLASLLLYLHEEWEQCVVNRDIKSSIKLGSQTIVLAGTMGYLAPECVTTGKASRESDVYSFGVVALEIICGRRPVEPRAEPSKTRLVEWVWSLYGKGQLLEAVDKGLSMEFDQRQMECLMTVGLWSCQWTRGCLWLEAVYKGLSMELDQRQMECLMTVGLWCCHADSTHRPSIRQVINVLSFEAPPPNLPMTMPVPMYFAPPMHMCKFSYTSSANPSDSQTSKWVFLQHLHLRFFYVIRLF